MVLLVLVNSQLHEDVVAELITCARNELFSYESTQNETTAALWTIFEEVQQANFYVDLSTCVHCLELWLNWFGLLEPLFDVHV